jgi:thiosulfate/3-mercaptopyruvate sulfurtransferase
MAHKTLVSAENLEKNSSSWRVFDCRHDLSKPDLGEQQYREAHIPGALFAHLERDLSAPRDGRSGRHPLPYPGAFIAWLGQQGLKPEDQIVCYDAGNGTIAARLWWMMRWAGHDAVAVLDGGLAKWQAEGRPVTAQVQRFPHTQYPVRMRPDTAVGIGFVEKRPKDVVLLDARAPERFRGEKEPIDPVAGHIPGAKNRYCIDNLTVDGVFKEPRQLKSEFADALQSTPASKVVAYCGSGVTACHNLLAMELAGLTGAKLYAGSWSDWISDPKRPVVTGAARG